jgi:hypothetical protein
VQWRDIDVLADWLPAIKAVAHAAIGAAKHAHQDVAELLALFCRMCALQRDAKRALNIFSWPWLRTLLDTAARYGALEAHTSPRMHALLHGSVAQCLCHPCMACCFQVAASTVRRPRDYDVCRHAHCCGESRE